jgi:hypothetical protein
MLGSVLAYETSSLDVWKDSVGDGMADSLNLKAMADKCVLIVAERLPEL